MVTPPIGSKCALMLPKKFINPQRTPARGLVINLLVDRKALVLIEEIWQFTGPQRAPLAEMCFPSGHIRQINWGWQEVPEVVERDTYIIVPAQPHNLMKPTAAAIELMIGHSIRDFQEINGLI